MIHEFSKHGDSSFVLALILLYRMGWALSNASFLFSFMPLAHACSLEEAFQPFYFSFRKRGIAQGNVKACRVLDDAFLWEKASKLAFP